MYPPRLCPRLNPLSWGQGTTLVVCSSVFFFSSNKNTGKAFVSFFLKKKITNLSAEETRKENTDRPGMQAGPAACGPRDLQWPPAELAHPVVAYWAYSARRVVLSGWGTHSSVLSVGQVTGPQRPKVPT